MERVHVGALTVHHATNHHIRVVEAEIAAALAYNRVADIPHQRRLLGRRQIQGVRRRRLWERVLAD